MNNNIKLFDTYSGYIFKQLYENFPKCINFEDVEKTVLLIEKDNKNVEEIVREMSLEEKNIIFSETLLWLTNNGFIDFQNSYPNTKRPVAPMPYMHFMCITLTIKGLNLLTSPKPKTLNKTKRLGDEIIEKFKQGALIEAGRLLSDGMFEFVIERGLK